MYTYVSVCVYTYVCNLILLEFGLQLLKSCVEYVYKYIILCVSQ